MTRGWKFNIIILAWREQTVGTMSRLLHISKQP